MEVSKVIEAIASAFKIDAVELGKKLKTEGSEEFAPDAPTKLATFITESFATARKDADGKATRRAWGQVTNVLKRSGFENPDGKEFDDLVLAAVGHFSAQQVEGDLTKMKPDELAKLPAVKELIRSGRTAVEALNASLKTELEAEKKKSTTALITGKIEAEQALLIEKFKVDLGEGATRTQRLAKMPKLLERERVAEKDGKLVMVDSDGEVETDGTGQPITFERHFSETIVPIFGTVDRRAGKGGAGAQGSGSGGSGSKAGAATFANEDELEAYLTAPGRTREERADATQAFYENLKKK